MVNNTKDEIQKEAVEAYLNSNKRSTIILGTGGGKSKVAIDILKQLNPGSILLLTNGELLRDESWRDECIKFGFDWGRVQSETYQKMYKMSGEWDMIVMDEVDFACTENYGKVFSNLRSRYLLCLTGFMPTEKREFISPLAPIVYDKPIVELQEEGVLNQSKLILVRYPLSSVREIKVPKKTGGYFLASEDSLYKYHNDNFQKAMIVKSKFDKDITLGLPVDEKKYKAADFKFKLAAAKRKSILNKSETSVKVVKLLLKQVLQSPNNKVIVFSALTEQADKFGIPTYHGKSTSTEKDLARLNSGEIKALATCKAITRGVNLVGVNHLIKESFDSSETDFYQTHGRLMRLSTDQVAKYIVLIPTYNNGTTTQADKWARNMIKGFKDSDIKTIQLTNNLEFMEWI